MDNRPQFLDGTSYCDPNKKLLKEWVWKTFRGSFAKDHSIRGDNHDFIGFWTKAGTLYYVSISISKG